jgi:hypothetical protein
MPGLVQLFEPATKKRGARSWLRLVTFFDKVPRRNRSPVAHPKTLLPSKPEAAIHASNSEGAY